MMVSREPVISMDSRIAFCARCSGIAAILDNPCALNSDSASKHGGYTPSYVRDEGKYPSISTAAAGGDPNHGTSSNVGAHEADALSSYSTSTYVSKPYQSINSSTGAGSQAVQGSMNLLDAYRSSMDKDVMCDTHGVKDCLLCALNSNRKSGAPPSMRKHLQWCGNATQSPLWWLSCE